MYFNFGDFVHLGSVHIRFQGGFAGKHCQVETTAADDSHDWTRVMDIYPEDVNALQVSLVFNQAIGCVRIYLVFICEIKDVRERMLGM